MEVHYHGRDTIDPIAHKLISMDIYLGESWSAGRKPCQLDEDQPSTQNISGFSELCVSHSTHCSKEMEQNHEQAVFVLLYPVSFLRFFYFLFYFFYFLPVRLVQIDCKFPVFFPLAFFFVVVVGAEDNIIFLLLKKEATKQNLLNRLKKKKPKQPSGFK